MSFGTCKSELNLFRNFYFLRNNVHPLKDHFTLSDVTEGLSEEQLSTAPKHQVTALNDCRQTSNGSFLGGRTNGHVSLGMFHQISLEQVQLNHLIFFFFSFILWPPSHFSFPIIFLYLLLVLVFFLLYFPMNLFSFSYPLITPQVARKMHSWCIFVHYIYHLQTQTPV